jgi:hypothetical protein
MATLVEPCVWGDIEACFPFWLDYFRFAMIFNRVRPY